MVKPENSSVLMWKQYARTISLTAERWPEERECPRASGVAARCAAASCSATRASSSGHRPSWRSSADLAAVQS